MIGEIFEQTDYQIVSAVAERLENTLTTEELIPYMEKYKGSCGLTRERYTSICDMFTEGKIRLVKSAWSNQPKDYIKEIYHLGAKPKFIHVENYKKINELKKNKKDWDENWRDYMEKYKVKDFEGYNQICFYAGEHYSRNARLYLNYGGITDFKVNKFQFVVEVFRDKDSWSSTNLGQEYVFEFVGENSQAEFVEHFRAIICRELAEQLVCERQKQLLEEEVSKTTALFGTILDKKTEN